MKAIVKLGYKDYVLNVEDAVKIMELLENAERYETQYHRGAEESETGESYNSHHIYDEIEDDRALQLMSDKTYRIAKLAGKAKPIS